MTRPGVGHRDHKFGRFTVVCIGAAALISACGGTKASLAQAINEELAKDRVCYAHGNMGSAPRWPLRVRRQMQLLGEGEMHPVLAAMRSAGQVKVTPTQVQDGWIRQTVDVIEPTDDAKKWWDNDTGWCVGTKAVAEVREWSPPEGPVLQVSYTWKLVDVPSWARKPAFQDIDGMSKPEDGMAIVQQTNNGWKVTF